MDHVFRTGISKLLAVEVEEKMFSILCVGCVESVSPRGTSEKPVEMRLELWGSLESVDGFVHEGHVDLTPWVSQDSSDDPHRRTGDSEGIDHDKGGGESHFLLVERVEKFCHVFVELSLADADAAILRKFRFERLQKFFEVLNPFLFLLKKFKHELRGDLVLCSML